MSCVMCHVSHVMCHYVFFVLFFSLFFTDIVVTLVGGGSVVNGATPSSFLLNLTEITKGSHKKITTESVIMIILWW